MYIKLVHETVMQCFYYKVVFIIIGTFRVQKMRNESSKYPILITAYETNNQEVFSKRTRNGCNVRLLFRNT